MLNGKTLVVSASLATGLWLAVIALIALYSGSPDEGLTDLSANEIGDFLAGSFAPLAFLWLVVAVLIQKAELAVQQQELVLTRDTLNRQADELKASARHLEAQTMILTDQLLENRRASRQKEALDQLQELSSRIFDSTLPTARFRQADGATHDFHMFANTDAIKELIKSGQLDEAIRRAGRELKRRALLTKDQQIDTTGAQTFSGYVLRMRQTARVLRSSIPEIGDTNLSDRIQNLELDDFLSTCDKWAEKCGVGRLRPD